MIAKKILAIDYGAKSIGVSFYNGSGNPVPLCVVKAVGWGADAKKILHIAKEKKADVIVVGVPHLRDGGVSDYGAKVLDFINVLKIASADDEFTKDIKIVTIDEIGSTNEAEVLLYRGGDRNFGKDKLDMTSACVILSRFLKSDRG